MYTPMAGAPDDERERRQLRATYHGAQKEVDDQLARLFGHLDATGLSASTLVVVTSDHGEMGGDHWLIEKLGYWDESFHIPLIIRDPDTSADGRGRIVRAFTESVDVLPTICTWLGIDVPVQVDGYPLQPFWAGDGATPEHWRTEAHWSWNFANPANRLAEQFFAVPMAYLTLDVVRGDDLKYVQFAADADVFPPLLFDLEADLHQLHDLVGAGGADALGWSATQRLLRWRMRNDDRTLSGTMLTPDGVVVARDPWR
jgi:arylsulfatase A-like enzyme